MPMVLIASPPISIVALNPAPSECASAISSEGLCVPTRVTHSFQSLASIEPDFLKFDVSLVRDIDKSSIKRSLLESLHQLADKIKARVIAEGVERPEEREALLALGIELGQGWLFHKPT